MQSDPKFGKLFLKSKIKQKALCLHHPTKAYAQSKPVFEHEPRNYILTVEELDALDDILEETIFSFQDPKTRLKLKIDRAYNCIKQRLLATLDGVFNRIYDLSDQHSKFAKFEKLASVFQDAKCEYEMETSAANTARLDDSVKILLGFENTRLFDSLIDAASIESILEEASRLFTQSIDNFDFSVSGNSQAVLKKIGRFRKSFGSVLQLIKYQTRSDPECYYTSASIAGRAKKGETSDLFLNQKASVQRLKSKFESFEKKRMLALGTSQSYDKNFVDGILNRSDRFANQNYINCYAIDETRFIFESQQVLLDSQMKTAETSLFTLLEFKQLTEQKKLSGVSSCLVKGHVEDLKISPNRQFVLVKSSNEFALFEEFDRRFLKTAKCDDFSIESAIFVQSAGRQVLAFVDFGGLFLLDLERSEMFFCCNYLNLKSVHYVDDDHVFLVSKNLEFGVFFLNELVASEFVNSEISDSNQIRSKGNKHLLCTDLQL